MFLGCAYGLLVCVTLHTALNMNTVVVTTRFEPSLGHSRSLGEYGHEIDVGVNRTYHNTLRVLDL